MNSGFCEGEERGECGERKIEQGISDVCVILCDRICDYHGLRASGLAGWGTEGCQQVFNRHGDGGHRREYRPGEAGDDRGKANFYGNLLLGSNYRSKFIRNLMME